MTDKGGGGLFSGLSMAFSATVDENDNEKAGDDEQETPKVTNKGVVDISGAPTVDLAPDSPPNSIQEGATDNNVDEAITEEEKDNSNKDSKEELDITEAEKTSDMPSEADEPEETAKAEPEEEGVLVEAPSADEDVKSTNPASEEGKAKAKPKKKAAPRASATSTTSTAATAPMTRGMKVHADTPIPNADKSLRLLRKFVSKTRAKISTDYGGSKSGGILRFFRGSNGKEDPTFVPYRHLVEVLLDGDDGEEDGEDEDTLPDEDQEHENSNADESDLVVDSIFGVSGDTMAKARSSVAAFCHLLSIWGHASSRLSEQQDTKSQQSFSELLVFGIDTAAQLVNHGCLDGVQICNLASAEEYLPAINMLSESILVADVTLERSELAAMKFLLSAGCRVKPGEDALLRGTHLLQAIRMLYHIYLTTESKANRTTSRAALQQLVTSIFARLVRTQAAMPPTPTTVGSPRSLQMSASTESTNEKQPFPSENHRDAFLVLRSICKLSMRNMPGDKMHSHVGLQTSGSNSMWDGDRDGPESIDNGGSSAEAVRPKQQAHLVSTSAIHPAMESKILALELLYYVLENVKFTRDFVVRSGPQFHSAIRNYLCVSLLKNCTSDNSQVVHLSLRMFALLVRNFRTILKNEVEAFVTNVFFVILDSKNSPIEHKNLVVTLFEEICSDPSTLAEIFLNYDCDLSAVDLFHRIVNTLSRVARSDAQEPQGGTTMSFVAGVGAARAEKQRSENRELRLDAMRALRQILASLHSSIVEPMNKDNDDGGEESANGKFPPEEISSVGSLGEETGDKASGETGKQNLVQIYDSKKKRRKEESEAALRFNQKPAAGIKYAAGCGHLDAEDPADIARYLLKNKDEFDKTMIGEYLGREASYQGGIVLKVLHEYVRLMDFGGLEFDDAIRFYLSGFRLPGEAQKIDRIMEKFAERYTEQNPDVFPTADVAFILAFSIIMLNTDLHNPAIKEERRMTKEGFIRNNRGIADGQDLPSELLFGIFERIKSSPISLKEDDDAREKTGDQVALPSALSPATFFSSHYDDLDRTRETNFQKERDHIVRTTESLLKRRRHSTYQAGDKKSTASRAGAHGKRAQTRFVRTEDSGLRDEYVSPMFEVTWGPALAAFSTAMESANGTVGALENIATDEELERAAENAAETIEVCLTGFKFAVGTAGLCGNDIARDSYMLALSRFSQLGTGALLEPRHLRCVQTLLSLGRDDGELLGSSWEHVFKALAEINRFHQLFHLMARNDRAAATAAKRRQKRLDERAKRKREQETRSVDTKSDDSLDGSESGDDDWSQSRGSLYDEELFSDEDDFMFDEDMDGKAIDEANAKAVYEAVSESIIEAIYERSSSFSVRGVKEFIFELCRVSRLEIDVSGYGGHAGSNSNTVDLTKVHYRQHHSLLSNNNNSSKDGDSQFHHSQPNIYSLQKLVEVTHYNMDSRPRLVFSDLWVTVSGHLTSTALHSNPAVAMYAVDSFRQLSIQFLQRGETEGFEVQKKFLKPLETVISQSEQVSTKELLLKCVERIVLMFGCDEVEDEVGSRRKGSLRSGWATILHIIAIAGSDTDEVVATMGFEMLKEQLKNSLEYEKAAKADESSSTSILTEHFVDAIDALFTYANGAHEELSLAAIDQLVMLSAYLGDEETPLPPLRRRTHHLSTNGEGTANGSDNPGKDFEHWWPILLGLSRAVDHGSPVVRSKALKFLLQTIERYFLGEGKSTAEETMQTMRLIFRGILTPVLEFAEMSPTNEAPPLPEDFERLFTVGAPKENGDEEPAATGWIETTFDDFMDGCVALCLQSIAAFDDDALVEEIFAMLNNCMFSDSGVLAVRGLKRLERFIAEDLDRKYVTDDTWATISHMLKRSLKVKGLPKMKDKNKDMDSSANEEESAELNGEGDEDDIREFVVEDGILSSRRYVGSNAAMIIGSLLTDERFERSIGVRWRLFLVAGLGRSVREWEQAASVISKYGSKNQASTPMPPDYLETAVYGRTWLARLISLLAKKDSVAKDRMSYADGYNPVAEAQKVVKEQTHKLLSVCIAKEAAGLQKGCTREDREVGKASTALVLSFLAGFDSMDSDHLSYLDWLNPVLLSWCTRSQNESIQKGVKALLEKTSPASPVKPSNVENGVTEPAPAPSPAPAPVPAPATADI